MIVVLQANGLPHEAAGGFVFEMIAYS